MNCIPSSHSSPHEPGGATLCGALIFPRISHLRTKGAMEARITQCPGLSTAPSWIILRRKGKLGLHRVSPHHKKRSSWPRFASNSWRSTLPVNLEVGRVRPRRAANGICEYCLRGSAGRFALPPTGSWLRFASDFLLDFALHEPYHDFGRAALLRRPDIRAVRQHSPTEKGFMVPIRVNSFDIVPYPCML